MALSTTWVKFGKDDQANRDVPIHDKRSTIWAVRRRYKRNSCNSTFRPSLVVDKFHIIETGEL